MAATAFIAHKIRVLLQEVDELVEDVVCSPTVAASTLDTTTSPSHPSLLEEEGVGEVQEEQEEVQEEEEGEELWKLMVLVEGCKTDGDAEELRFQALVSEEDIILASRRHTLRSQNHHRLLHTRQRDLLFRPHRL
mgnify:FL=1